MVKSSPFVSERIEDMATYVAGMGDLVMGGKEILLYVYFIYELKQCSDREGQTQHVGQLMTEIKWSFWKLREYIEEGNGIKLSDSVEAHLRLMSYIYLLFIYVFIFILTQRHAY